MPVPPPLYRFLAGFLLLGKAALLIRHLGNLTLFYQILRYPDQAKGQLCYGRRLPLRSSAAGFLGFSGLYLGLYFLERDTFLLGGFAVTFLAFFEQLLRSLAPERSRERMIIENLLKKS